MVRFIQALSWSIPITSRDFFLNVVKQVELSHSSVRHIDTSLALPVSDQPQMDMLVRCFNIDTTPRSTISHINNLLFTTHFRQDCFFIESIAVFY